MRILKNTARSTPVATAVHRSNGMRTITSTPRLRTKRLAASIASLFAVLAPASALALETWTVTSCADANIGDPVTKTGTLRYALLNATSPAIIDMHSLTCSTITLGLGQLTTNIDTVFLTGTSPNPLTIDASALPQTAGSYRVLAHTATAAGATLYAYNLRLIGGHNTGPNKTAGGCLYSAGSVVLHNTYVGHCTVSNSSTIHPAYGGGIYAVGNVSLYGTTVAYNYATANGKAGSGGGIFTQGNLKIYAGSDIHQNYAYSKTWFAQGGNAHSLGTATISSSYLGRGGARSSSALGEGGGLYAKSSATLTNSTVANNYASGGVIGSGGGVFAYAGLSTMNSVLSGNAADTAGAGAYVNGSLVARYSTFSGSHGNSGSAVPSGIQVDGSSALISRSTISGNAGPGFGMEPKQPVGSTLQVSLSTISGNAYGGLVLQDVAAAKFYGSTIAFNRVPGLGAGVTLFPSASGMALTLQSTLISNNTANGAADDITVENTNPFTVNGGNLTAPANNLIFSSTIPANKLPGDTLTGACPHLERLRDNGGSTQTHRLLSRSVAIDTGNNALGAAYDQRGKSLPYVRVSGPLADIGAYEVQQDDIIFGSDFDGCP
jgi:hypothetical protein